MFRKNAFNKAAILCGLMSLLIVGLSTANAQNAKRFSRFMVPVDPVTLKTEGAEVQLWGIKPAQSAETYLELRAVEKMKDMIGSEMVDCKIMSAKVITAPSARCTTATNEDIAITLLQNGLVVRDQRELFGSVFASSYEDAENAAKSGGYGVWALVNAPDVTLIRSVLNSPTKLSLAILILVLLPILSVIIMGFIVRGSFKKLLDYQIKERNRRMEKELKLQKRERDLVLSSIKTELNENKSKVEAFLTVYLQMLSELKDPDKTPKYQTSGDVIARGPNFSIDSYRTNIDTLTKLDMNLSAKVTNFYSSITAEPEYMNLSATTPREEATRTVEQVVDDARGLLPQVDRILETVNNSLDTNNS